nr:hypothetical protein [Tanacetum cinerariifolium]
MLDSKAYKEYYTVASRAEPPKAKTKYKKKAVEYVTSPKSKTNSASKGTKLKSKAKVTKHAMKKEPLMKTKVEGLAVLSKAAISKAKQVKMVTKRSKIDFYISQQVAHVMELTFSQRFLMSNNKRLSVQMKELVHTRGVCTPSGNEFTDEETMDGEEDDEVLKELYDDVNVNLEKGNAEMTDADQEGSQQLNKADKLVQSSYVSSDFTSKFLNLKNPYLVENKIASLMETSAPHTITILELTSGLTITTPPPPPFFNFILQQQTPTISTPTYTNPTVPLQKIPNFASVFKFDQRVDSTMKKIIKNQVKEQVSKIMPNIEKYVTESLGAKVLVRSTNQPEHNPENKPYLFDLRKPLPIIQDHRGRQIIPKDYFIHKYIEYLKGGESSRRYSTSVMKTTAATYELKWIEDLVPELWSPVVVQYDQHAYYGTLH